MMKKLTLLFRLLAATGVVVAATTSVLADPAYIYGLHDNGGEGYMGSNKGWIVFTEAIGHNPYDTSGRDYTSWSNQGYGVIVRLNNGYGSDGTLPYQAYYQDFATRCANYVSHSSGVLYWIIGNETNLPREWPGNNNGDPNTGEPITVARYVDCYNRCYTAIKNAVPGAKLVPVPSGTWAPPYSAQGIEGFVDYWVNILNSIGASKIDGLALHVYSHGCDPSLITDQTKMGPPYENIYYHFQVYRNYMAAIPSTMKTKPVLITECDENVECADYSSPRHAWYNVNNGWVRAAYAEINNWNNANSQKIRCLVLFRWIMATEGEWTFGIQDRDQVIADFQQAVAYGYQWGTASSCVGLGPGNPSGSNLSLTAAYYIESGRNNTAQYGRYALDGQSTTKWCCNAANSGGTATLAVDLGSTSTVTGYIVRHASWGAEPAYMNTKYYRIESASSIFGPWTVEYDVDNSCQDAYNRFIYGTPKSLRYVRLVITNPGIDTYVRLPEFEIYGTAGTRDTITVYAEDYQGGVNAASGTDYYDTTSGNSGGQYRSHNVDIETCTDGRYNVGWIAAGEWLNFPIQGQGTGVYTLYMRYATPNSAKTCSFKLNGAALTGTLSLNNTGGWQVWQTLNCGNVNIGTGWKTIQFYCNSDSFNIQRFWLVPASSTPTINRSPSTLAPSCTAGSNASSQTFTVANSGGGTLSYTITDNVSWLSCSPTSGTSTGEADTITVTYATSGLSAGTYYGTITISDPNASNNPQTIAVTLTVNSSKTTVSENFESMPSWSSSFDASWGSAAAWSIVGGGQSGNALQAARSSQGSSAKVKVYNITANANYTLTVYIKCPSYGGSYWAECAYKLGSYTAEDFDGNSGTWTMIQKFANDGTNGNGNTWVQYTKTFNSGSSTQISVGYKLGSSGGGGPTVLWDTLRIQ
ncbi:MAG: DUF5010 C-terminal domain-containing protein [Phycisphaerae bacterium]|nr:DUF5010 C-terminal domain-containing protein [Phycisphaerae bacterium]